MAYFKRYADQVNEIARKAFADYRNAETTFRRAQEQKKLYPKRAGMQTAAYVAKAAKAEASYVLAKEDFDIAKKKFEGSRQEIESVRKEFLSDAAAYFSADPKAVDQNTITLLNSGILSSDELSRLMNDAIEVNNYTMARIIGNTAKNEANEMNRKGEYKAARELYCVSDLASNTKRGKLEDAMNLLCYAFGRTVQNPLMIDDWDDLVTEAIATLSADNEDHQEDRE